MIVRRCSSVRLRSDNSAITGAGVLPAATRSLISTERHWSAVNCPISGEGSSSERPEMISSIRPVSVQSD
jgi:hypothetical protein